MDDVEFFQKHGAVVLRNALTSSEVALLREGIEHVLQHPSPRAIVASSNDDAGRFFEDFNRWPDVPSLHTFVHSTRLARLGAQLMQSRTATLFHDHILVKEQGTATKTPFHQDQPYYDIEGAQTVSFWIPVEPVDEATCLELIAGTHLGPWYCPRTFKTAVAKWFPEGCLPEFPAEHPGTVLRWALQPGDCIAFHHLTVHGAPGVAGTHPRRPVYSLRLVGDDVTFQPRPWVPSPDLAPMLMLLGNDPRQAGQPLSGPLFPTLFTCPVDLQAYPLTGPASVRAGLVARLRAQYLASGAVVLPHFLTAHALGLMLKEVQAAVDKAYVSRDGHNVYLDSGDPALPADHPRNARVRTVVGSIAYDLLPPHSLLRKLYAYEPLLELVRGVLGLATLHRNADGIGCCTVNVFQPGEEQGFHYDETMFSVTLMLAEAEAGGQFDYFPNLRREHGSPEEVATEHAAIQRALEGSTDGLHNLPIRPGALAIFNGHHALHRVDVVKGSATRLVAVLAFNEKADVKNSEEVRELFWGRRVPTPRDDVP